MTTALRRNKICIKPSRIQGHGVFAEADIQPGELIEECYTLILKQTDNLYDYTFSIKKEGVDDDLAAMPLGCGVVYNHSTVPNADYELDQTTSYMIFTAIKPIKAGEEIFISYGDHWFAIRETKIKQATFAYKLKYWLFKDPMLRRMFLVTSAIILFGLIISGGNL